MTHIELMQRAIQLAADNVLHGGGPFGAVIAREGEIVAEGVNRVTASCDPTAHAEVQAIRAAGSALGTYDLTGCSIYASCEPCPMCLGAIYWARLSHLYFAAGQRDTAAAGFDDAAIYREFALAPSLRRLPSQVLLPAEGLRPFRLWAAQADKTPY